MTSLLKKQDLLALGVGLWALGKTYSLKLKAQSPKPFDLQVTASAESAVTIITMKVWDNEWILEPLAGRSTFFTKRMFGGLAVYLHERQMLVLVEPTKTGRWTWHGVLVCTEYEHHASICAEFRGLGPHDILRKWLYIDSTHKRFESTMEAVTRCVARGDPRFGIVPRARVRGRNRKS